VLQTHEVVSAALGYLLFEYLENPLGLGEKCGSRLDEILMRMPVPQGGNMCVDSGCLFR
jgi:hypothetical protein